MPTRLKLETVGCHLVQNLFVFHVPQKKDVKIKIYEALICPIFYGCEALSVTLWKERGLKVFKNRVLQGIFALIR